MILAGTASNRRLEVRRMGLIMAREADGCLSVTGCVCRGPKINKYLLQSTHVRMNVLIQSILSFTLVYIHQSYNIYDSLSYTRY
jgi:hypothetical protein